MAVSENFLKACKVVLNEYEGITYENVAGDSGGPTFVGIAYNYHKDWPGWKKIDLSRPITTSYISQLINNRELMDLVYDYYYEEYWLRYHLDALPYPVAFEIFDQTLNMGPGGCFRGVQKVLNSFNYNGRYGDDLVEDGAYGAKTRAMLESCAARESAKLAKALNAYQGSYYIDISHARPVNRKFFAGWLNRVEIQ